MGPVRNESQEINVCVMVSPNRQRQTANFRKVQEYNATYPRSPKLTDTEVPVKRINTEVDSALPLYNTPCHAADSEGRRVLGLVSILSIEEDTFAPST